jgi:hypothetical protein
MPHRSISVDQGVGARESLDHVQCEPPDSVRSLGAASTVPNIGRGRRPRRWRTPYQVICEAWTKDPSIFKTNPHHLIPGPHT